MTTRARRRERVASRSGSFFALRVILVAMVRLLALVAVGFACMLALGGFRDPPLAERHVVLVMIDGLRWQEVFRGVDDAFLTKERGLVEDPAPILARFGGASAEERRAKLMPFLWTTIAKDGAIWGNRDQGSKVEVTNGVFVSYPGYSETICGFVDKSIDSNKKIVNPNRNVFEWMNGLDGFRGRVWVFGCWDVFPFIFGLPRSGLPVDDTMGPFAPPAGSPPVTPAIATVNRLRAEVPKRWPGGHFDGMLQPIVTEWIPLAKPRALFVGFGETDEWAHESDYGHYLEAARRADQYIAELWTLLQSMPEYRGTTTLIVTCDHGRGTNEAGPREWNNHNARTIGSHEMWIAVLGPDTPALGCVQDGPKLEQAQIAATVARAVGLDWRQAEPRAKPPIAEAFGTAPAKPREPR